MFNSFCILLMRMNNKPTSDGNYLLAIAEMVATIIVIAIVRNT